MYWQSSGSKHRSISKSPLPTPHISPPMETWTQNWKLCACTICEYQTVYSRTSEQRTLWEQYKFSCCVLCREVVLFSEVQNVLKLEGNQLFGTLKSVLCREVYYIMSLSRRVHCWRFYCIPTHIRVCMGMRLICSLEDMPYNDAW